jgi:2-polyprenyl-3-methyl-5-hydroxy-6-metoxy-1,4-benzoquinol methylase
MVISINIIIIIIIIIFYLNYNKTINKFSNSIEINTYDSSNYEYITVAALAGLNNRIQVILSYLYFAKKQGKKLKIVWLLNDQCPERFDKLFYPIKDVDIIYDPIDESLYDYKNWDKENNEYIKEKYYRLLHPIITIETDIINMKQLLSYDNKNYIACHIRRTDALTHQWYKEHTKSDEEYIAFINSCPANYKIYIATDCKITQKKFIDIYGDRMIYKLILDTDQLRQTTLADAVKDMYVCAGAKYFMRSYGTFSDTIEHIRNLDNEKYDPVIEYLENYKIDGDEIYQPATNIKYSEHSRFNYKTKECSHWYSLQIVNNILNSNNTIKYKNILILGVALGGQIIHLLNKDSNVKVTGVDISDMNFHIVEKYSDRNRLRLINEDANKYIMNTNDVYDVIICDIFNGMNVADFVLTTPFLDKINKMLINPKSKFLLNTTNKSDKEHVIFLLKKSINNSKIEIINNPKLVNNLYFVTKN